MKTFKQFLILLFSAAALQAQGYFSRSFTSDGSPSTAIMEACGGNYAADRGNPLLGLMNPVLLSSENGGRIRFSAQLNGLQTRESRTFPVLDSFDSFLADNIYVQNHTFRAAYDMGLRCSWNQFSFAVASVSRYDLNYSYAEEVRGSLYSVYNRDPLIGIHEVEFTGSIRALNIAVSADVNNRLGLGCSWSALTAANLSEGYGVTVLGAPSGALASDTTTFFPSTYTMDPAGEFIAGLRFTPVKRLDILASARFTGSLDFSGVQVLPSRDAGTGLPAYNPVADSLATAMNIQLPAQYSLGLVYRPANILPTELYLQTEYRAGDGFENSAADTSSRVPLSSHWSFHAGVHHEFFTGVPFRVGFSYLPSAVSSSLNRSILSFGSGFHNEMAALDFSVSFTEFQYAYPDLFPIKGEVRNSLDTVKEQQIRYYLALTVNL